MPQAFLVGELVEVLWPNQLAGLIARIDFVFPRRDRLYRLVGGWVASRSELVAFNDQRPVDPKAKVFAFIRIGQGQHLHAEAMPQRYDGIRDHACIEE
jgi:hypothetical protein